MRNRSSYSARLLCGTAMAVVTMTAAPAFAEGKAINIEPQSLATALREFASQSQQAILVSPALADGKSSQGVHDTADPEVALTQLLQGTGLTYRRSGEALLIVSASDPQSGSAAGDGAGTVEALIVTAQKREENIQDVPIAMSAFSQEDLTRSQVAGGPDLITQVPNMTFTKTNFSSYSIQLRGIGTQAISATTDPGVAVAFNNTPFIQNRFFEQEFYDLQRVEVLRGPQGTLYGRNATAGVVNIISAKPKFTAEAKIAADVANYNSSRIEGMINIPLVQDAVALRLAGAWTKREGYSTNEITGNPIDGRNIWSTRASLRITPNDRIDANLIWEHFQEDDDRLRSGKQLCKKDVVTDVGGIPTPNFEQPLQTYGQPGLHIAVQPRFSQGCIRESLYSPDSFQTPNGASVPYYVPLSAIGLPAAFFDPYASQTQSRDLRVIESTIDPDYRAKSDLGELQVSWDITEGLTLTSETGYMADSVYSLQDFNRFNTVPGAWETSGSHFDRLASEGLLREDGKFCDPQLGCSDRLVAVDVSSATARQFNQEFRLASNFDGPFNFSLGTNFTRFDLEAKYYVFINSLTLVAAANNGTNPTFNSEFPYQPGVSDNRECLEHGLAPGDPDVGYGYLCAYIEPNPISNLQDTGHNYFLSKNPYKLISYAVFGEAYYELSDALKITAGLRWTVDKKEAPRVPSWALVGNSVGYPVAEVVNQEWREPTGRLAIDWKPDFAFTDQTLLYASYAHGYKAGGANPPPFVNPLSAQVFSGGGVTGGEFASATRPKTFDAEFVDAFELGAKNTFADGRATLNLAAFYYDYKNYQISEIVDRSAFNQNYDAEVWGLEIEASWRPLENLKLGFKGGYENTRIADGEQAVDLMDRTAGNPEWVVVRPFPTNPSSCILPTALFTLTGPLPQAPGEDSIDVTGLNLNPNGLVYDIGQGGGAADGGCERAYLVGLDPATDEIYEANPQEAVFFWGTGNYPGWNPDWAPNHGEGFYKQLGGNELPNAPNYTATVTADYSLPLANDWLATLHTDLYWQSESWWRIFNDHEYDKLDEYFTMNLAAIFTNEEAGWTVMAYVKNVFDRDSITGAFLNSDDTALTTNVFLTEPRLYGLRVTKEWNGRPWLPGLDPTHAGPYPLTIEVGGQVQRQKAPYETVRPPFADDFSPAVDIFDETQHRDLDWGDGREVKLTWRPNGSSWRVSAGLRYGETNGATPLTHAEEKLSGCPVANKYCDYEPLILQNEYNSADIAVSNREEHKLVDFLVGHDVGIGNRLQSSVSGGLRYAQFQSRTNLSVDANPDWVLPQNWYKYNLARHTDLRAKVDSARKFEGAGPALEWDASAQLFANEAVGRVGFDWSVTGSVLFGHQVTSVQGQGTARHIEGAGNIVLFPVDVEPIDFQERRSRSATVPALSLSLGLSYDIQRVNLGVGYRWERYFDVLDVGDDQAKGADRTMDGPYFKIAVGFGG